MLLKCRYLAQFSVAELAKNGAAISQAELQCPFLTHARRTLTTGVFQTNAETRESIEPQQSGN